MLAEKIAQKQLFGHFLVFQRSYIPSSCKWNTGCYITGQLWKLNHSDSGGPCISIPSNQFETCPQIVSITTLKGYLRTDKIQRPTSGSFQTCGLWCRAYVFVITQVPKKINHGEGFRKVVFVVVWHIEACQSGKWVTCPILAYKFTSVWEFIIA